MTAKADKNDIIKIGVSACLIGQKVRYDGDHQQDRYILETLARYLELVPVCPEVEVGMDTPRETVQLEGKAAAPSMVAPGSGTDWTVRMNRYAKKRSVELAAEDLCGFVFKKGSPSCGVWRTKVYNARGAFKRIGRGLFAEQMIRTCPLLPVEDEGRLHDARLRENFLERIFACHRLKKAFAGRWRRAAVVDFHSREKFLLMAHSPRHYKQLDKLVAAVAKHGPAKFRDLYMTYFMEALAVRATPRRHLKVLQHLVGHLRKHLTKEEQTRVLAVIEDYRAGLAPLIVPLTLLKHYIELHQVPCAERQTYLNPHPQELMLRNQV